MQLQRLEHIEQTQAVDGMFDSTSSASIHHISKPKQKVASCDIMSLEAVHSALSLKLTL